MRRRIFSLAFLLSLLLCVGTLCVWLLGFGRSLEVTWGDARTARYSVSAFRASYDPQARWFHYTAYFEVVKQSGFRELTPKDFQDDWHFVDDRRWPGLRTYHLAGPRGIGKVLMTGDQYSVLIQPGWIVLASLPMTIAGVMAIRRSMRWKRRRRMNHCTECAYDLMGNVSGVCPECGTAVAEKAEVST